MIAPLRLALSVLSLIAAGAAQAQIRDPLTSALSDQDELQEPQQPPLPTLRPAAPGSVADSAVGKVGQRQTGAQAAGIAVSGRINSRIANRVQSRIRNRIDRNYDPQANATDPFAVAEDETQSTVRARR